MWTESYTRRHTTGTGAGPRTPGPSEAGTPPAVSARDSHAGGARGSTNGVAGEVAPISPELPALQQQQQQQMLLAANAPNDQDPVPPPSRRSGASWLASAGGRPSALPVLQPPQQCPQGSTSTSLPPPSAAALAHAPATFHRTRLPPLPPVPASEASASASQSASATASAGAQSEGAAADVAPQAHVLGASHTDACGPAHEELAPGATATGGGYPAGASGPSADTDPHAMAPAGAPALSVDVPAAAQGPEAAAHDAEAAAAMEAHRRALMLLTAGTSSSSTAAGALPTSSSRDVSFTSPTPILSSDNPQSPHAPQQQRPQSQPSSRPKLHPQLQRAMAVAHEAARRASTPGAGAGQPPASAFAAPSQRRLSSGPFVRLGLGVSGKATAGSSTSGSGALALTTAPSADTALMRPLVRTASSAEMVYSMGFPGTAAEASAVLHGAVAGGASQPPSGSHDRGSQQQQPQQRWHARQEGLEVAKVVAQEPVGLGGGSFSDMDSESEYMSTAILDSPRTAAREAHAVGVGRCGPGRTSVAAR